MATSACCGTSASTVEAGEIACIVGSNGAGKTTLLRTISGWCRRPRGRIRFAGEDITVARAPIRCSARGIAHVPGRAAAVPRADRARQPAARRLSAPRRRAEIRRDLDYVFSLFPILRERQRQDATTLSGGEQQMCAIGRGIMSRPKLLMIDELSLGLAPRLVERLSEALLRDQPHRHHHPAGRAGRADRLRDRAPRLHHRDRPRDHARHDAGARRRPGDPASLSRDVNDCYPSPLSAPTAARQSRACDRESRWRAAPTSTSRR